MDKEIFRIRKTKIKLFRSSFAHGMATIEFSIDLPNYSIFSNTFIIRESSELRKFYQIALFQFIDYFVEEKYNATEGK